MNFLEEIKNIELEETNKQEKVIQEIVDDEVRRLIDETIERNRGNKND